MSKFLMAALLLSCCISCDRDIHPIKTKLLSQKNPTSYVFTRPVPEVREKILTAFKDDDLMRDFYSSFPTTQYFFFAVESREHAVFAERIFANRENQDDVYLHSYGTPICLSPVYFAGGKPLRYRAEFHLHLTSLDDNSTKVTITTHDPTVINGSKCCGLHGYMANDVTVEPTTIEEYKILLFIGRVLGAGDMPRLFTSCLKLSERSVRI